MSDSWPSAKTTDSPISRSVTVPASRSFSQMARNPTSKVFILFASSAIPVSGDTHSTLVVMISLIFIYTSRNTRLCSLMRFLRFLLGYSHYSQQFAIRRRDDRVRGIIVTQYFLRILWVEVRTDRARSRL